MKDEVKVKGIGRRRSNQSEQTEPAVLPEAASRLINRNPGLATATLSMTLSTMLRTERLIVRRWVSGDRKPFADMNSDPEVMKYFPRVLSHEESEGLADRIEKHFVTHGFGLWALEIPDVAPFAGFVGLAVPGFNASFTPCVEIGWRLARAYWGHGYATEAARAALSFGFDELRLVEILSFTVPGNARSRRIMEKLGMTHDPRDDFEHPSLPDGHPLRWHVLYRKVGKSAAPPG